MALTMGAAASAFGMTAVMAKPERAERGRADDEHDEEPQQGRRRWGVGVVEERAERGGDGHQQDAR